MIKSYSWTSIVSPQPSGRVVGTPAGAGPAGGRPSLAWLAARAGGAGDALRRKGPGGGQQAERDSALNDEMSKGEQGRPAALLLAPESAFLRGRFRLFPMAAVMV